MIKKDITIINKLGLHARAAAKLVTCASQFTSDIRLSCNGQDVNGKSIMGVMMLAAAKNSSITVTAEGDDGSTAVTALEKLVADRFGEEE
ncbi:Phosphotransferase system, phosphocarrier protein HPr [hydrothermal vent metagenome]|uniref:Phosphotransferase system, phosphocarrier protein HPr n=1 Tax=hydrothermal vent metagenome TaxID=652676 RepID=A0A3B1B227_9ZZZZ